MIFLEGVTDRTIAETLIRAILLVQADAEELPKEADAWYDHQLVGLKAYRADQELGEIIRVEHFPAQDLLVVKAGENEVLVPFVKAIVPEVDVKAGRVVMTPPLGLFEEIEE